MATQAFNRHPDNVLFNMIIRLQVKQLSDVTRATTEVQKQETRVSKAGRCVPNYPGTQSAKSFIHKHLHSWQSHLKQISAFLIHGKGIWWSSDECCYMFKDGADDQSFRLEGPHLLHHQQTTLTEQAIYKEILWQQIVEKVHLPTPQIQLYDASGKPVRRIEFDTTLGQATPEIHTEDVVEQPMENGQFPQIEVLGLPTTLQHQTSFQENSTALPILFTTLQQPQPQFPQIQVLGLPTTPQPKRPSRKIPQLYQFYSPPLNSHNHNFPKYKFLACQLHHSPNVIPGKFHSFTNSIHHPSTATTTISPNTSSWLANYTTAQTSFQENSTALPILSTTLHTTTPTTIFGTSEPFSTNHRK